MKLHFWSFRKGRLYFFIVTIFLIAIGLVLSTALTPSQRGQRYFNLGCQVVGEDKQLYWESHFNLCVYFEDGSYLASKNTSLIKFNSLNLPVWQMDLVVHHQMKKYGDEVYLLSEQIVAQPEHALNLREDLIIRLSMLDQSQKVIDYTDFKLSNLKKPIKGQVPSRLNQGRKVIEKSHLNSIHRIPSSPLQKSYPMFQPGYFLLTDAINSQISVVDKEFDKIIWTKTFDFQSQIHDAQVLKNGKILVFMNGNREKKSSIGYLNLDSGTYEPFLGGEYGPYFYASWGGGLQDLGNDQYLVNGDENCFCAYIIDRNSKKVLWQIDSRRTTNRDHFFQEAKWLSDLSSFLKNNGSTFKIAK